MHAVCKNNFCVGGLIQALYMDTENVDAIIYSGYIYGNIFNINASLLPDLHLY